MAIPRGGGGGGGGGVEGWNCSFIVEGNSLLNASHVLPIDGLSPTHQSDSRLASHVFFLITSF